DLDIQYVRERSLWLDLKIILKTIPAVMAEVRDMQRPRRQPRRPIRLVEGSLFTPHSNPGVDRRLSGHELTSVKQLGYPAPSRSPFGAAMFRLVHDRIGDRAYDSDTLDAEPRRMASR